MGSSITAFTTSPGADAARDGGGRLGLADGEVVQAFRFAVDLTDAERAAINRQFGGRRFAYNWTVAALKGDLDRYHASGESTEPPSFYGMRKRWNRAKPHECVDRETGGVPPVQETGP